MKRTAKALVTLLFCLSILTVTLVPAFAASVGKVKNVKATNVTYNSATITWSKVSRASGYQVQQYNASKKKWVKYGKDLKSSQRSLKLSKLKTGTTYKFRIRAFSKALIGRKVTYGSYSSTVSVKPMPTKVTKLKASAKTSYAKLSWSKVSGASGYVVQTYNSKKKWVNVAKVKSNSATIKKLKINSTYKYRVAAYRTVGKKTYTGAYSSTLTVKTYLGQVTGLKVSSVKPTSAKLSWKSVSEASGYQIQQYVSKKWKTIAVSKKTAYTLSTTPNTSYTIRVVAYKTVSKTNYLGNVSSTAKFKTTVASASKLVMSKELPTSVVLSWKKVSNVSGYQIQRLVSGKWKNLKATTSLSYTVTSLVPGTKYSFRVAPYVKVGSKVYYGGVSNTVTYTPVVSAATALKVQGVTSSSISVAWNGASNVAGYKVQSLVGGSWKDVASVNSTSYTYSSLSQATEYKLRVVSYYESKGKVYYGAPTNEVTAKTVLASVAGIELLEITDTKATIEWNVLGGADGYKVYQKNGNNYSEIGDTTETYFKVTGLKTNTSYTFKVAAYYKSGSTKVVGDSSPEVTGRTAEFAVGNLRAIDTNVTGAEDQPQYRIAWTAPKKVIKSTTQEDGSVVNEYEVYKTYIYEEYDSEKQQWVNPQGTDTPYITHAFAYRYANFDKDFETKAEYDGKLYTTVTWSEASDAKSYQIQYSTNGGTDWRYFEGGKTYSAGTTSAKIILPPNVTAKIRVLADNAKVRVKAFDAKKVEKTNWSVLRTIGSISGEATVKTNAAGAFNKNSNESKTLYTLMLAQAINNTKEDRVSSYNMTYKGDTDADISAISVSFVYKGILPLYWEGKWYNDGDRVELTFDNINKFLDFIKLVTKKDVGLADDLMEGLKENANYSGSVSGGEFTYTNQNGQMDVMNIKDMLPPQEEAYAYLFDAENINDFDKKISDINVTENADGTKTVKIKIKEEEIANGKKAAVHSGFVQSLSDIGDAMPGSSIKIGATEVVAVINKDYTINSLNNKSPFELSVKIYIDDNGNMVDASSSGVGIGMTIKGGMNFDYKLAR